MVDTEAFQDATRALNITACVLGGGHYAVDVPRWGGILGDHAEHWQECKRCPAVRFGLIHAYKPNATMQWGPWRDRNEIAKENKARTIAGGDDTGK